MARIGENVFRKTKTRHSEQLAALCNLAVAIISQCPDALHAQCAGCECDIEICVEVLALKYVWPKTLHFSHDARESRKP
jgi:hypothetical protein